MAIFSQFCLSVIAHFSAIFAKFDKDRFRSCGKQILDRTIDGAAEVKVGFQNDAPSINFDWSRQFRFENPSKARVKNRGGGGGYSEFEPIHQRSDEDDEEEETASLTSGRTYSSMSSSSTASGASQMVISLRADNFKNNSFKWIRNVKQIPST